MVTMDIQIFCELLRPVAISLLSSFTVGFLAIQSSCPYAPQLATATSSLQTLQRGKCGAESVINFTFSAKAILAIKLPAKTRRGSNMPGLCLFLPMAWFPLNTHESLMSLLGKTGPTTDPTSIRQQDTQGLPWLRWDLWGLLVEPSHGSLKVRDYDPIGIQNPQPQIMASALTIASTAESQSITISDQPGTIRHFCIYCVYIYIWLLLFMPIQLLISVWFVVTIPMATILSATFVKELEVLFEHLIVSLGHIYICISYTYFYICVYIYIWVNYNISLTWIKAILGWFL